MLPISLNTVPLYSTIFIYPVSIPHAILLFDKVINLLITPRVLVKGFAQSGLQIFNKSLEPVAKLPLLSFAKPLTILQNKKKFNFKLMI